MCIYIEREEYCNDVCFCLFVLNIVFFLFNFLKRLKGLSMSV